MSVNGVFLFLLTREAYIGSFIEQLIITIVVLNSHYHMYTVLKLWYRVGLSLYTVLSVLKEGLVGWIIRNIRRKDICFIKSFVSFVSVCYY